MKRSWIATSVFCAAFGLSAVAAKAAPITFYDYWYDTSNPLNQFGQNVDKAFQNHNFGQVERYPHYAGPTDGTNGQSPAAWSIWKLEAPDGEAINSFTVETSAVYDNGGNSYSAGDHVRIEWSSSSNGDWAELYSYQWDNGSFVDKAGTKILTTPESTVYVRISADKVDYSGYWVGSASGQQSTNLRFRTFKVTGDVSPVPEPSSILLFGSAGMGWFLTMRRH